MQAGYRFRNGNGKDRIVCEVTLRMEEGKILCFDGVLLVNRSDDVACDGIYHISYLFRTTEVSYSFISPAAK